MNSTKACLSGHQFLIATHERLSKNKQITTMTIVLKNDEVPFRVSLLVVKKSTSKIAAIAKP